MFSLDFSIATLTEIGISLNATSNTNTFTIPIYSTSTVPPETSTGFCSTFETGLDCSDFLYDLAFSEASFTGPIEAGSGSGVVSDEFGDMGSEDSALDWFVEDE